MGTITRIENSILHEYPYPIAKCYEKVIGARDLFERWDKVRFLFEVTLKYCSCASISAYLRTSHEDAQINGALRYLTRPSLGHWYNIFFLTSKYLQAKDAPLFPKECFEKVRDRTNLISGWNALRSYLAPDKQPHSEYTSLMQFMETMVTYRNRTAGHGSPQSEHIEKMVPLLENALVDLLLHLDVVRQLPLIYLSEIRVERTSFIHVVFRLMGTNKVLLKDYVAAKADSLLGMDKQLFLGRPNMDIPALSLHPLAIFSQDEVYLLQNSDLKHNVEYICHNTGGTYSADRIYEDFREKLGSVLLDDDSHSVDLDKEQIYSGALKISLIDGTIEAEERENLCKIAGQLNMSEAQVKEIEKRYFDESLKEEPSQTKRHEGSSAGTTGVAKTTKRHGKHLLFFPYASVRLGFWSDLVSRLAASAHKQGFVFSMVAPDPLADYDSAFMTALLADLEGILETHNPELIIMAPSPSRAFLGLFEKYFTKIKVPLITIDTEFHDYDYFETNNYAPPPIIQIDNIAGGELAAILLLESCMNLPEGKLQYLVMPGIDDAPHSIARIQGFTQGIRAKFPDARIKSLPSGWFQRKKAREVMIGFMEDADITKYRGIFCCNDEMALGVYSFLCAAFSNVERARFQIVGFNNTAEMQSTLENDRTGLLLGTIDQNLDTYVKTILSIANELLAGKKVEKRYLIEPRSKKRPQP